MKRGLSAAGLTLTVLLAGPGSSAAEQATPRDNAFNPTAFATAPASDEVKRFTIRSKRSC